MNKTLIIILTTLNFSLQAFVPLSNFELDQSVIQHECIKANGLDIFNKANEKALCDIIVNSSVCENVEPVKRRQCSPENNVESNAAVEFISCLKGVWGSAVEFMKFIGSVIDYIIDSEYRSNANDELINTLGSAKHFLAMEWSRSMSETDGWGPVHYARAAKHFSSTLSRIIYNMLQETYYATQANYACLNPVARTEAICKFAATAIIPPAIVMAKIGKYLLKSGKKVANLGQKAAKKDLEDKLLLSKRDLDKNREDLDLDEVDQDVQSAKQYNSVHINYLERIDIRNKKFLDKNPDSIAKVSNVTVDNIESVISKLGIPVKNADIEQYGVKFRSVRITAEMLKKSNTPASKDLLKTLEINKIDSITIDPSKLIDEARSIIRDGKSVTVSSKGMAALLSNKFNVDLMKRDSIKTIKANSKNYSDQNVELLAKQLNEEGFSVRVIEQNKVDPKTKKTIKLKALQFNRFAADKNHPGVKRLERFRNRDFRQKIIFYPDQLNGANGSSARSTRAVSFNFSNLEEIIQGGHTATVPHEFRHARFEYNRSIGKESVYDYRVRHTVKDGALHDGNAYKQYFSMEEVYNHSQDIYKTAKNLSKDTNIQASINSLKGKVKVISDITRGFRQQNDSLNFNFMSKISPKTINVIKDQSGMPVVKTNPGNFMYFQKDTNGIIKIVIREGPIEHSLPVANKEMKQHLIKLQAALKDPRFINNKEALAREVQKVSNFVRDRNQDRRRLLNQLSPKINKLNDELDNATLTNASVEELKEIARQIAQISKGR